MTEDDVAYNRLLLTDPEAARAKIAQDREELLAASASELAQGFASVAPPADAAVLQGEMAAWLAYAIHDALAPGSQGWYDDARAHVRPSGCEPSDITVPVLLPHGRLGTDVPFGHGQWLATHIPGYDLAGRILLGRTERPVQAVEPLIHLPCLDQAHALGDEAADNHLVRGTAPVLRLGQLPVAVGVGLVSHSGAGPGELQPRRIPGA